MHAEEFISRYGAMEYEVKESRAFYELNQEKLAQYDTIGDIKDLVEKQRNQVMKELEEANATIAELTQRLEKEIELLKNRQWEEKDEMGEAHRVEVNELEQKLQVERIALANLKSKQMKEKRED